MAPELFSDKSASIRSDIYALGVVLYQLIRLTSRNGKNRTLRPSKDHSTKKKTLQNSITARFTAKRVLERLERPTAL
jgi:serine/threonine protein kinase